MTWRWYANATMFTFKTESRFISIFVYFISIYEFQCLFINLIVNEKVFHTESRKKYVNP